MWAFLIVCAQKHGGSRPWSRRLSAQIAFAPVFNVLDFGGEDGSLGFPVPLLSVGGDVPLWVSLAAGDFLVKILIGLAMLIPYGAVLTGLIKPSEAY